MSSSANTYFMVPENSTLNFYCGATAKDAPYNPQNAYTAMFLNSGQFTIGNMNTSPGTGDFGTINFNSGNYLVRTSRADGVAIGGYGVSGGTININQAANVQAWNSTTPTTPPVSSVGVTSSNQSCSVNITGGVLSTQRYNGKGTFNTINVGGSQGKLTITGQGKVITGYSEADYNVPELVEAGTWNIQSGIVGYYTGPASGNTQTSEWNAIVGGEVTLPVLPGNTGQDLSVPAIGSYGSANGGYWNSVTINPKATLTLGTEKSGSTTGGYNSADFFLGGDDSFVNNYGEIIVNNVNQTTTIGIVYPASWNNNPGSTLTINSGAMLSVYDEGVENSASTTNPSQPAGQITISGKLNLFKSAPLTNNGNLTVAQGGEITGLNADGNLAGAITIINTKEGTVNLDGTVTLVQAAEFENSGTLDIGPIGQVVTTATQSNGAPTGGKLTNNAGGTVTSENPCYYGNKAFFKLKL